MQILLTTANPIKLTNPSAVEDIHVYCIVNQ